MKKYTYIVFNKPFNVISQFSPEGDKKTLADYLKIAKDIYPIGRLDYDSEGLLLLTNDNQLKARLTDLKYNHEREYLVFADGKPCSDAKAMFSRGIKFNDYTSKPAKIEFINNPAWLWERVPPPRTYDTHEYSWLKIVLTEGKNRQVRKMTAAVGCPTLRLVRTRILNIKLGKLSPGEFRKLTDAELRELISLISK